MKKIFLINIFILIFASSYSQSGCVGCFDTQVSGTTPSAIGTQTKALGDYTFASGLESEALGTSSMALGHKAKALSLRSMAIGFLCEARQTSSYSLGNFVVTDAPFSFVIGTGYDHNEDDMLINNRSNSLMIGFNSIYPTLFISTSDSRTKTGKIGIGNIVDPEAKLHIKADLNEDADLMLDPGSNANYAALKFGNQNNIIRAKTSDNMIFSSDADFVFENGNIGIGTNLPDEKLHIAGKTKTTQLQLTEGAGEGKILLSDANGNAHWGLAAGIDDGDWTLHSNGQDIFRSGGNVGLGTSNPDAQLDLADIYPAGGKNLQIGNDAYLSDVDNEHTLGIISQTDSQRGSIKLGLSSPKIVGNNGNIGIGTENPTSKLTVNGKILAEEIEVIENVPSSDFVFENDYPLMELHELEKFIINNKHLPEIQSTEEFKSNGYNMNDMDDLLLRKVEELTLYIIELEKKIVELNKIYVDEK